MRAINFASVVFAICASAIWPDVALAACQCTCINGNVQAVCTNAIEIRPICAPRVCPITPPSVRPLNTPSVPPIGTKTCRMEQVLNPYTNQYEWKRICR